MIDWPFRDVMGEKDLAGIAVDASPAPNIPLQVVRYKLDSFLSKTNWVVFITKKFDWLGGICWGYVKSKFLGKLKKYNLSQKIASPSHAYITEVT